MNMASRRRLLVLYLLAAAMLVALGGRLWYLQVMNNTAFTKLAAANQTRSVIVPAVRGQILDDVGNRLVTNTTALVVSVDMMTLSQQPGGVAPVLHRLAPLLGMPYKLLAAKTRLCTKGVSPPCWAGSPYQPIPVDQHVSDQVALQVMEQPKLFPGVTAQVQPVIDYRQPVGANPAQVLGYLQPITPQEITSRHLPVTGFSGVDLVGQAGLEAQYDSQLRGQAGTQVLSVNAAGDVTGTIRQTQPVNGDELITSLNSQIQADAQQALAGAIAKSRASGNVVNQGAAVVMTTTGRVVAMASYPDYNPSVWTGGISQQEFNYLFGPDYGEPIINWITQGQYAPGSTFKVTSTAAAVANGYPLDGLYDCPASVHIGTQNFINDGNPSLGPMTFAQALIQSCDTVYYNLGYDMYLHDNVKANDAPSPNAPVQTMQQMELAWGFGQDTGVDLPAESRGSIPTRRWLYYMWKDNAHAGQNWCKNGKQFGSYVQQIEYQDCLSGWQWEPGQAAIAAIGQGYVTVTPLQLANAYVALANGGTLYSPRIGEALISPVTGQVVQRIDPPVVRHLPVSGYTLAYIRNALAGVVTQGTAAGAFGGFPLNQVCVAGKTGTAQIFGKNATSVFASFAPCQDPKYVVLVMVPNSGFGADVAAPAVRQIWDGIYGLEGHQAAVPGGLVPSAAPRITSTGAIEAPPGYATSGTTGGKLWRADRRASPRAGSPRRGPPPGAGRGRRWPGRPPRTRGCGTWTGCWSWWCSG
ncbi:MAG: penicillin-binding protein 2 [Actinobacteria bacterium]|nr:penicillin-binding protein 2 [Actinomycetota bacterium]